MIEIRETSDHLLLTSMNEVVQNLHVAWHPDIFKPFDRKAIEKFFGELFSEENCKAFLATYDGINVGYILFFLRKTKENPFQYARDYLHIDQIMVSAEFRGKGIGSALIEKAIEVAIETGIQIVTLDFWVKNEDAGAFFRKVGFSDIRGQMELKL